MTVNTGSIDSFAINGRRLELLVGSDIKASISLDELNYAKVGDQGNFEITAPGQRWEFAATNPASLTLAKIQGAVSKALDDTDTSTNDYPRAFSGAGSVSIPAEFRAWSLYVDGTGATIRGISVPDGFRLSRASNIPGEIVPGLPFDPGASATVIVDGIREV